MGEEEEEDEEVDGVSEEEDEQGDITAGAHDPSESSCYPPKVSITKHN